MSLLLGLKTESAATMSPQAVQLTFVDGADQPQTSLSDRVFTTRNVCITGGVAASAAFAALSAKVGILAASQVVAHGTIAFLQPGIAIFGFAAKTAISMTANLAIAAALPILLPVVSTAVVITIVVAISFFALRALLAQLSIQEGFVNMKNFVSNLPQILMEKMPSLPSFSALFGLNKVKRKPLTADEKAAKLKTELQQANAETISIFKELEKRTVDPKKNTAAQRTLAALSGDYISTR
jgi:hypothetical protein